MKYKLIEKTEDYIIVNKPAGLLVHGTSNTQEETMSDQLLRDFPEIAKVGEDPFRPGIVHRLDRPVSGLLVVARTQKSFENLKQQFQKRTIGKYYTALVYGRTDNDYDEISFPVERSTKTGKIISLPPTVRGEPNKGGRHALTKFEVIQRFINYTLLEVRIKTGRTHQIRTHLAAYGHPLVGDNLYSTKKTRAKNAKLGLNRIFLHAHCLELINLSGERKKYKIELPGELKKILKIIK